jgi:hypothetical protein
MKLRSKFTGSLRRKSLRGFRGYPTGTIAFYGPDNERASKVAVGIVADESGEVVELERWFSDETDVRRDESIGLAVDRFLRDHKVLSVAMTDGIIGCPHEEEIDYPKGKACPKCPYWKNRDRFSGELIQ